MKLGKCYQLLELDTWGFIILCYICLLEISCNKKYSKTKQNCTYMCHYIYVYL